MIHVNGADTCENQKHQPVDFERTEDEVAFELRMCKHKEPGKRATS